MKYFKYIIPASILLVASSVFGAPVINHFGNLAPLANQIYDLGTTTPNYEWKNIFTKNLIVSGTCTGCLSGIIGNVSTSTNETKGYLPYWTSTNGSPATLGSVATTSLTATSPLSLSQAISVIGSSASALSIPASTASVNGYLSAVDWTTFNNKWDLASTTIGIAYGGTGKTSFTANQLHYGNFEQVATTTFTPSADFTTTGTIGALVGGANSGLSLNMATAHSWTALQTFANASATQLTVSAQAYLATTTIPDSRGYSNNLNEIITHLSESSSNTLLDKSRSTLTVSGGVVTYTLYAIDGYGIWNFGGRIYSDGVPSASVNLTSGSDLSPKTNEIYFYLNGTTPTLAVSTTGEPTVSHIDVATFVIGSTTADTATVYAYNRNGYETESFYQRTLSRFEEAGCLYHSGFEPTVTSAALSIAASDGTPGRWFNGIFEMYATTSVSLAQEFTVIKASGYATSTSITALNQYSDGTAMGAGEKQNVVWGIVATSTTYGGTKATSIRLYALLQSKPTAVYTTNAQVRQDVYEATNYYPSDHELKKVFLPIARTIVDGTSFITFDTGLYYRDLRGKVTSGGGAATPTDVSGLVPYVSAVRSIDLGIYNYITGGGVFASSTSIFNSMVGIGGTTTPGGKLSVAKYATSNAPAFLVSTSTQTSTSTAFLIDKNGFVGIGTTTPSSTLTVTGNGLFTHNLGIGSTTPTAKLAVQGNAGQTTSIVSIATTTSGGLTNTALQIDANGNVGVHTTNTGSYDMTVNGSVFMGSSTGVTIFESTISAAKFPGGIGSDAELTLRSEGTADMIFQAGGLEQARLTTTGLAVRSTGVSAGDVFLANGNATVANKLSLSYLTSTSTTASTFAGKVGIATTAPLYTLDVDGYIDVTKPYAYKIDGNTTLYASTTNHTLLGGWDSGVNFNSTANYSTAFGEKALYTATSTQQNTAFGYHALYLASGSGPGNANTYGGYNLAIGANAMGHTTGSQNGSYNVGIGPNALFNDTDGQSNFGMGYNALYNNTIGDSNVAIGASAFTTGTSTGYNIAIGSGAMLNYYGARSTTASVGANTAIGWSALWGLLSGTRNVAIGMAAGYSMTTGSNNTIISSQSGSSYGPTTGSHNIMIGYDIDLPSHTASNQLDIGNIIYGTSISEAGTTVSSGKIGIATSSPWRTFSVSGTMSAAGLTLNTGAATASLCLSSSNEITYNTDNETCVASSERYKKNIETLTVSDEIMQLRPVSFEYKELEGVKYGFIAEEVNAINPRLTSSDKEGRPNGIRWSEITTLLVKKVQTMVADITGLRAEMEEQKARITALEKQVQALSK